MGLSDSLHWIAWFTKSIILLTITITIITLLFKWRVKDGVAVLTNSNFSTIWFFLFLYSITVIMFCFMISSFFSKSSSASMAAALIWFLTYMPFPMTADSFDKLTDFTKIILCFFSNTSMAYGFKLIMRFEGAGFGLQWHNIFKPITIDEAFTVGHCLIMFVVDSFLYGIITWYIEKIYPGDYGVPLKWYFPFTFQYWRGARKIDVEEMQFNNIKTNENIEEGPSYALPGMETRNLRKLYDNSKVAVHSLNLKMYENEITVLLGHNGAGE